MKPTQSTRAPKNLEKVSKNRSKSAEWSLAKWWNNNIPTCSSQSLDQTTVIQTIKTLKGSKSNSNQWGLEERVQKHWYVGILLRFLRALIRLDLDALVPSFTWKHWLLIGIGICLRLVTGGPKMDLKTLLFWYLNPFILRQEWDLWVYGMNFCLHPQCKLACICWFEERKLMAMALVGCHYEFSAGNTALAWSHSFYERPSG